MIGKLKGVVDSVEEEALILDVNGVGYLVSASARTLRAMPAVGEPAELLIETLCARRRDQTLRLSHGGRARLVSPAAERAGRRRQGRARDSRRALGGSFERGGRAAGQGDDGARAGRWPEARRAPRARTQGQGAGACVADFAHAEAGLERAPKLAKAAEDAVLALVGLGYAQPQAAAAVARISAQLGPAAETAALIRAGLKELAQ